ncbi:MAG TPA: HlyD family efflux transporter periplasmic adaptor subunit [Thermoguttaceae bacterium]|nr:HlyD family efflux transporter periplasmic adaptor subunit [Thermoguttaceae bacterium]
MKQYVGRLLGLLIVTALAVVVAITAMLSGWGQENGKKDQQPKTDVPATPVTVMKLEPETIEITDSYSGMIEPWERFSLGFEIAGRVSELGVNAAGKPLDDGDPIVPGQLLARLDAELLGYRLKEVEAQRAEVEAQRAEADARLKEAEANLTQATSDMRRADDLRDRRTGAITEAQYQNTVTALKVAGAQLELARALIAKAGALGARIEAQIQTATENIEDTQLYAPAVEGGTSARLVLAKRKINPGESVSPHQAIMEIIQVDKVLLAVGVPEAFVGDIRPGQPVHVELLARDRFRRQRSRIDGQIFRMAEAADDTTGLFEVEIALPNPDGQWKPGLIALGRIVVGTMNGFRVPLDNTMVLKYEAALKDEELSKDRELLELLKDEKNEVLYLYAVDGENRARRMVLKEWIEQGTDAIVPLEQLPPERRTVVNRGHHRLMEGRGVMILEE